MKPAVIKSKPAKKNQSCKNELKLYKQAVDQISDILSGSIQNPNFLIIQIKEVLHKFSKAPKGIKICEHGLQDITALRRLRESMLDHPVLSKDKFAHTYVGMVHLTKRNEELPEILELIKRVNRYCYQFDDHAYVIELLHQEVPDLKS